MTEALDLGSVIGGRYRIDQVLGAGGMGVVVAATHLELGNRVAIKLLRDELQHHAPLVERFIREGRAVARLQTEHVCKVFDVARLDSGAPYIVMELLDGSDLAHTVAHRALPLTIAVGYVLEACIAIAEAHAAGIVHRDLKPANVFVVRRPDGGPLVKVLDFGIAKVFEGDARLTRTRVLMGSPGYMSPEQIESARDVDPRADIWALGVTLYELLAARLPFPAASPTEIAVKVATQPPVPLDVDPALAAIVYRCLEKAPDRRYPDVVALADALVPFGGPAARSVARSVALAAGRGERGTAPASVPPAPPVGAVATPPTPPPSVTDAARRSRAWIFAVIGLLVIGGGITAATLAGRHANAPADAAPALAPPVADAAIDARPDAAPPIDAAIDAPGDAPPDARRHTHDTTVPIDQQVQQALAAGAESCRKVIAAKTPVPNFTILECACILKDVARAKQAYAAMPAGDIKKGLAGMCASFGVKL